MSEALFSGNVKGLTKEEIELCFKGVPSFSIDDDICLIDLLVNNDIAKSKREAREFISSKAISVNGDVVTDENYLINEDIAIDNKIVVIRRGKKKYYLGTIK